MAISRMQEPRQLYGLGSFVKSIGKGVKKFVKSPLGKAAILGIGAFGLPGGAFGMKGFLPTNLRSLSGIGSAIFSGGSAPTGGEGFLGGLIGKVPGGGFTVGAIGSILAASGMDPEEIEATKRDPEKLKIYLKDYYRKTNPDKTEAEVEEFVQTNISEYATGGRVGFAEGKMPFPEEEFKKFLQERGEQQRMQDQNRLMQEFLQYLKRDKPIAVKDGGRIGLKDSIKFMTEKELEETMPGLARGEVKNYELKKKANRMEKLMELLREYEKNKKAAGGMPTGIMRTNQAGVMERDYRDEGGFVPVGIKERADDVPAMLSKNEFVMTADAVRGAGDGSIEKGAQKMYDQMKRLENKVA